MCICISGDTTVNKKRRKNYVEEEEQEEHKRGIHQETNQFIRPLKI